MSSQPLQQINKSIDRLWVGVVISIALTFALGLSVMQWVYNYTKQPYVYLLKPNGKGEKVKWVFYGVFDQQKQGIAIPTYITQEKWDEVIRRNIRNAKMKSAGIFGKGNIIDFETLSKFEETSSNGIARESEINWESIE